MKVRIIIPFFAGLLLATSGGQIDSPVPVAAQQDSEYALPEAGGEHLRVETGLGPLHVWRPEDFDPRTAGTVVYIHGYYTSVDQTWTDDHLATQFGDSGRNALFIAIEAPQSNAEEVSWKSLEDLLRTVEDRTPFPLPRGPLVVVSYSGGYRTVLLWLRDPRVQQIILLDGLYAGQAEFRSWLSRSSSAKPHRLVLASIDTWRQSYRFARRTSGTALRRSIPATASTFSPRETRARLLYLRSQYEHGEIISSGKVIPVLLQDSPLRALAPDKAESTTALPHKPALHK
jgi:hypothetical protein